MKSIVLVLLLLISTHAFAEEYEMNELPMYGGQHDPQVESNKEHSKSAAELGWKYLYRGDLSTAMKRFNQAWMFDRKNSDAFWGFGIIMGKRAEKEETEKNLTESIHLLTTAHELQPDNGKITGDLAFSYAILGSHLTSQGKDGKVNYQKAEELFADAYKHEPKYAPIPANWAVLKFYVGDYQTSKTLISEAQGLGYTPNPDFLKELNEKAE
jgi:tetratricopeptide (TPR) repeat protein